MNEKGLEMNKKTSTPIGARSSDVEITRWYNDIDINRLLIEMSNNQEDYLVFDSITLDEAQITQRLTEAFYIINEGKNIVIPVNLGGSDAGTYKGDHWTGLVITREEDTVHIYYEDSLGNPIPALLLTQIHNVFQDAQIHDLQVRQQDNGYDCGPLTILNLDALARTGKLPENTDENAIIEQRTTLRDLALNSPEQLVADDEEASSDDDDSEVDESGEEYSEDEEDSGLKLLEESKESLGEGLYNELKQIIEEKNSNIVDLYQLSEKLKENLTVSNKSYAKEKEAIDELENAYESDTSMVSDTDGAIGVDIANELGESYEGIISDLIVNKKLKNQIKTKLKQQKSKLKIKEKLKMKGEISHLNGKIAKTEALLKNELFKKLQTTNAEIAKANSARDAATQIAEAQKRAQELQEELDQANAAIIETQKLAQEDAARLREELAAKEKAQKEFQEKLDQVMSELAEAHSTRDAAIAKAEAKTEKQREKAKSELAETQDLKTANSEEELFDDQNHHQTSSPSALVDLLLDRDSQSDNQPKALVGQSHDQNDEVQECTCVIS